MFSCAEQKHIAGLSKEIETLEKAVFPCPENQQSIFKSRNSKLRTKIINSQLENIKKSKSNEFYVIESYNYDWGYNYSIYLIIDGKVIGFEKDDFLKSYNKFEVDLYNYKKRITLLNEKKYAEIEKLYFEKCLTSTHIFVISKEMKLVHSSVNLDCYSYDNEY